MKRVADRIANWIGAAVVLTGMLLILCSPWIVLGIIVWAMTR